MENGCGISSSVAQAHAAESNPEQQTVGQHLDQQIANARANVERLCIAKAKAETAQILDYPMQFIYQLAY